MEHQWWLFALVCLLAVASAGQVAQAAASGRERTGTRVRPVPATILIDDLWAADHEKQKAVARLREWSERWGCRGKISVIPLSHRRGRWGRIDREIPGFSREELASFLRTVRSLAPHWELTPELITHGKAWDVVNDRPLDLREDRWAASQDARSLQAYVEFALKVHKNAGLAPTGVTSPWSFASPVEEAYAEAVGRAMFGVFRARVSWYFLHTDGRAPRVVWRDDELGIKVVHIGANCADIFGGLKGKSRDEALRAADRLIAGDGRSGQIVEHVRAGRPAILLAHFDELYDRGSLVPMLALEEIVRRIAENLRDRVRWVTPGELASEVAAKE